MHVTVIVVAGVTVTVAVPIFVLSWLEVAVTVELVPVVTACAVNTPFASTVPPVVEPLIPHETVES